VKVDLERDDVKRLYCNINGSSGPGYPWVRLGATKGEVLKNFPDVVADAVIELLTLWATFDGSNFPEEPSELVKMGLTSPFRVFIKNEPHKKKKRETGRLRVIVSVPLHVVLAEMLLFGPQDELEIAHWGTIPSKPGMGLSLDEDIKSIFVHVQGSMPKEKASADVRGFDFSVSAYINELETETRINLCGADANSAFARCARACTHVKNRAVFATSDGQFYEQIVPGVRKSGEKVTASANSRQRVALAFAVGADAAIAMGDDSVERPVVDAVAKYLEYGFVIDPYDVTVDTFEFCSQTFQGGKAWPTNPGKMIYNLLNTQPKDFAEKQSYWCAFVFELRHHPDLQSVIIPLVEGSRWAAQIE
jgi:hypothetical protein